MSLLDDETVLGMLAKPVAALFRLQGEVQASHGAFVYKGSRLTLSK
ncbi:MAG: hypothetical protein LZ169_05145 [Thaumarchaeota archaeon]|jgi:hypothetical protein|nr:hypothetical protein [Candidatus Wolframiiraptor allenii]